MPTSSPSWNRSFWRDGHQHLTRRTLAVVGLLVVLVVLASPPVGAGPARSGSGHPVQPRATTVTTAGGSDSSERLPGTTLEAEERDDGGTNAAPWIIGSGIAAAVAVGVGGTILKRRAG